MRNQLLAEGDFIRHQRTAIKGNVWLCPARLYFYKNYSCVSLGVLRINGSFKMKLTSCIRQLQKMDVAILSGLPVGISLN